jgi:hypothetical protein
VAVYIANFGKENYEWPECLRRGTIASMNDVGLFPLWQDGNRETYVQKILNSGETHNKSTASRWFNLMTVVSQTSSDIWIHSDTKYLWWTTSLSEEPTFERRRETIGAGRDVIICHKRCTGWRNENSARNPLPWAGLHPKAKTFLSTEATLQKLSSDNAEYAIALVNGSPLSRWHERKDWLQKIDTSKSKSSAGLVYNDEQKAIWRMADTAFQTAAVSNGQEVKRTLKNKTVNFNSKDELQNYIAKLLNGQEKICALTELPLNLMEKEGDPELRASIDRIDSDGHYEEGNLQVVCKFANRWKNDSMNDEFLRLINLLKD